jgi:hypothetical protein
MRESAEPSLKIAATRSKVGEADEAPVQSADDEQDHRDPVQRVEAAHRRAVDAVAIVGVISFCDCHA